MRQYLPRLVGAFFLLAQISAAQSQGGGGGGDSKGAEAVACRQKYPDGTLVNKLSSEDGCPMHEFLRQDCERSLRSTAS